MKIGTYNIWNSESLGIRTDSLLREILAKDLDILALQEVPSAFYEAAAALYPYSVYEQYAGEDEGLALLSRYPIVHSDWMHGKADALHAGIDLRGMRLSVTNVHLPWQSILQREEQIVFISEFLNGVCADRRVLLGDFNGDGDSVHGFLTGLNSLRGRECAPVWLDTAAAYAALHKTVFPPTLDTIGNPRWQGKNSVYAPKTMDRIYVQDSFAPFALMNVRMFGMQADERTGLCPSDHYGVAAQITFA